MSSERATTDGSLFEGLARAFKPEGAFLEDLRAAGFDPRAPQVRYPTQVLIDVLDVIHRHAFPELSRLEAHREAGRRMISSFFDTILGKVLHTLLRMLGLKRFLLRLPKIAPMGVTGLKVQVEQEGPSTLRLTFHAQSAQSADFVAGTIEGATAVTSDNFRVEITLREPTHYELLVSGLR